MVLSNKHSPFLVCYDDVLLKKLSGNVVLGCYQ